MGGEIHSCFHFTRNYQQNSPIRLKAGCEPKKNDGTSNSEKTQAGEQAHFHGLMLTPLHYNILGRIFGRGWISQAKIWVGKGYVMLHACKQMNVLR